MVKPFWIKVIFALQFVTVTLFLIEFLNTVLGIEIIKVSWEVHEFIEIGILTSLVFAVILSAFLARTLSQRNEKVEAQLKIASGEFANLIEQKFAAWDLSQAERDVALLNLKGFSVPEIAEMRGKSAGTIKAQNAAIYKKANVSGRTQLIVSFVEDMVDQAIEGQSDVSAV